MTPTCILLRSPARVAVRCDAESLHALLVAIAGVDAAVVPERWVDCETDQRDW